MKFRLAGCAIVIENGMIVMDCNPVQLIIKQGLNQTGLGLNVSTRRPFKFSGGSSSMNLKASLLVLIIYFVLLTTLAKSTYLYFPKSVRSNVKV